MHRRTLRLMTPAAVPLGNWMAVMEAAELMAVELGVLLEQWHDLDGFTPTRDLWDSVDECRTALAAYKAARHFQAVKKGEA